jgi:hypothetical protein
VTLLIAVNAPTLLILAMLVPLYLMSKSVPLCTMEKLVVDKLAALPVVFWLSVGNVQFVSVPDEGVPSAPLGTT